MQEALERIAALKERVANLSVEGHRQYNPGWHLALDLRSPLPPDLAGALKTVAADHSPPDGVDALSAFRFYD